MCTLLNLIFVFTQYYKTYNDSCSECFCFVPFHLTNYTKSKNKNHLPNPSQTTPRSITEHKKSSLGSRDELLSCEPKNAYAGDRLTFAIYRRRRERTRLYTYTCLHIRGARTHVTAAGGYTLIGSCRGSSRIYFYPDLLRGGLLLRV